MKRRGNSIGEVACICSNDSVGISGTWVDGACRAILFSARNGWWLAGEVNENLANPQRLLTTCNQVPMRSARLLDESCAAIVLDDEPSWIGEIEVLPIGPDHL